MNRKMLWLVLVVCALLLSACKMQVGTIFQPDGSGQLTSGFGFTAQDKLALQNLSSANTTGGNDLCSNLQKQSKSMPGAQFHEEQRGSETWCITSQPFADLAALRKAYASMDGVTINRLELGQGGNFVYDVTLDFNSDPSTASLPIDISWAVTVPGQVGTNNADSVSGATLTWNLKPGVKRTVHVESTSPAPNLWILLGGGAFLCLCFVGLVIMGIIGFLTLRKK